MAHKEQKDYCVSIMRKYPSHFQEKNVLDCGSLDINGNNRYLFTNCNYLGIDIGQGKNVDIATPIHEFNYPDESFDTIISTECFEHDMHYEKSLKNICRLLKSGGLFIFTCATINRPEHGTLRSEIISSPLTSAISEWSNYYKNLTENDIRAVINIDYIFLIYEFNIEYGHHDLNFWGIKK
jgi:SAM-dependent methyltransferase